VFPRILPPAAARRLSSPASRWLSPAPRFSPAARPRPGPRCSPAPHAARPPCQPFLPLGDANYYELMSGGDFEGSLAGWTLTGGAKPIAGSEPYAATGSLGANSLSLPAGASAQSPFMCVDVRYLSFRFFARNEALLASVLVQVR
jgi:hypothetical protein